MLYEFRKKIKQLSLGKRKLILNKMNTYVLLEEKAWDRYLSKEQRKEAFSNCEEACEQFIYVATLLLDEKKTLRETYALVKDCFSVTSFQYEYYFTILDRYKSDLTPKERKAFDANVMRQSPPKKKFSNLKTKAVQRG